MFSLTFRPPGLKMKTGLSEDISGKTVSGRDGAKGIQKSGSRDEQKEEEKTIFDQQTHLLGNVYPDGSGDHMFFGFFLLCFHVIPQTALCRPEADTCAL